jgi:aminoglycoside phosphotransferase (APT) family kinase protein
MKELEDISQYTEWNKIVEVNKGWSKDRKFYIEDNDGKKLLLRISDFKNHNSKKKEFESMGKVYELGINMSEPIDFGICGDGKCVYLLLSWIEGIASDEVMNTFSEEEQYNFGSKAGKMLKVLHSIPAPGEQQDWEQRMLIKFDNHLKRYKDCGIKVAHDESAITYIQDNVSLLENRPQQYHHGDFHIGNLIITSKNELGLIDFNRWDYGDPFEEFYKMMIFSRELSIPFARGQIKGYFNNSISDNFFDILALYLADVILFSIVWAIPYGEDEVRGMIKRAEMILTDYDNFTRTVPKWFTVNNGVKDEYK